MTTDSQVHDATRTVAATSVATTSCTNALPAMAPAKKPKRFTGVDFKSATNFVLKMKREYPTPKSAADHLLEAKSLQDDFVGDSLSTDPMAPKTPQPEQEKLTEYSRIWDTIYDSQALCALTEEPAGADLIFDQGDNITGKIFCEEVARICVAALKSPYACDNTFEVKSVIPFSEPYTVDLENPPPEKDYNEYFKTLKDDIHWERKPRENSYPCIKDLAGMLYAFMTSA
ncbi:uncharacterized protein LOC107851119 [Capsicum annuum]|uniref:uncharacterized protein LOC107851119 n=1 Tax=Capsicum annuum TaxID=4072 RepID=UPI001FB0B0F1|nr:uncharacterized protein LOC107851119 [Capsicum annuum]